MVQQSQKIKFGGGLISVLSGWLGWLAGPETPHPQKWIKVVPLDGPRPQKNTSKLIPRKLRDRKKGIKAVPLEAARPQTNASNLLPCQLCNRKKSIEIVPRMLCFCKKDIKDIAPCAQRQRKIHRHCSPKGSACEQMQQILFVWKLRNHKRRIEATPLDALPPQKKTHWRACPCAKWIKIHRCYFMGARELQKTKKVLLQRLRNHEKCIECTPRLLCVSKMHRRCRPTRAKKNKDDSSNLHHECFAYAENASNVLLARRICHHKKRVESIARKLRPCKKKRRRCRHVCAKAREHA